MSNRILSWAIPVKYRGMPMMAWGVVALYLTTFASFSWLNLITSLAMICAGPAMFIYGKQLATKVK